MLVEHRIDDVDERLVAVEQAVPAGQQVALQPALAEVFREHLHDPPLGRQVVVAGDELGHPGPVGRLEDRLQPVRGCLVRTEQPERRRVHPDHVAEHLAEGVSRFAERAFPGEGTASA